jgi:hypothetical protein
MFNPMNDRVNWHIDEEGTLHVFLGHHLKLFTMQDVSEAQAVDLIHEVLRDMEYVWNEDGTLTRVEI